MNDINRLTLHRPAWLEETNNDSAIVLDTRISIQRNIEHIPFPQKASLLEKEHLFESISKVLETTSLLGEKPLYLNLQSLSPIAVTLLFERELITVPLIHGAGDRGVILGENRANISFNTENHLTLFLQSSSTSIEKSWQELDALDTALGSELSYAYDESQGFLLNKTDDSGTGLSLSSTLHLPGLLLTNTLHQVLTGVAQAGILAEGKFKEGNDSWGSLFRVTSGAYSGKNEEEILEVHQQCLAEITLREKEARIKLFTEAPLEMEDKIWRSLGVLQNCRLLSIPQLFNLTSALRLGIEENIIENKLSLTSLNSLICSSLQGSVSLLMDSEPSKGSDLDQQRAEIVRTLLQ